MSGLLRPLRAVWLNAQIVYLEWAQREMHPLHPDVPEVIRDLAQLRAERAAS